MKKALLLTLGTLLILVLPAQKNYRHIALLNATAHIGNGKVIDNSLIAINNGSIETVMDSRGFRISPASYDTVIDLAGKHIYPALINANNILGLHDAEAVRATLDFADVGALNPHIRTLIAYNTDNIIVPTVKTNGVLYTQATPRGGVISGSSSIMALEGWNWEDAVLKPDDGIHLNFPRMVERKFTEEGVTTAANKKHEEEMSRLHSFFSNAVAYCKTPVTGEKNIRFEAMRPVFNGKANLYVHADKAKDIVAAIAFVKKYNIQKTVLTGGRESYKVTRELREAGIPVMLNRVNDLPENVDDPVDLVYSLPYLLQKDSVLFCLQLEGDMEAMQSRNLPFNAGAAVAYGLSREQALSAITLNAAKILGIEDRLGSIEEGKLASLVVSEGDILDMRTNNVTHAWLAGKPVTLTNRQTELYLRYKTKHGIK